MRQSDLEPAGWSHELEVVVRIHPCVVSLSLKSHPVEDVEASRASRAAREVADVRENQDDDTAERQDQRQLDSSLEVVSHTNG